MTIEPRQIARKLDTKLREASRDEAWYGVTRGQFRRWFRELASSVILLIDEQEIHYASATIDHDTGAAEIVLFTDELLIRISLGPEDATTDARSMTVKAIPRRPKSIAIDGSGSLLEGAVTTDEPWPGDLSVVLEYDDFRLPLPGPNSSQANRTDLAELVAALASGLTPS